MRLRDSRARVDAFHGNRHKIPEAKHRPRESTPSTITHRDIRGLGKVSRIFCCCCLLDRTGDGRKYRVGVGSNEPDRSNDNHQDYGQHYCVLSNILALVFPPQPDKNVFHFHPPAKTAQNKSDCLKSYPTRYTYVLWKKISLLQINNLREGPIPSRRVSQ
jgi:hypothetical protein